MTTKFFAIAGMLLLTATAPVLADSANKAQPTTTADNGEQNKVVCRRIETIGTRLNSQRVCRTKSEWAAQLAADRQALERIQTSRLPGE